MRTEKLESLTTVAVAFPLVSVLLVMTKKRLCRLCEYPLEKKDRAQEKLDYLDYFSQGGQMSNTGRRFPIGRFSGGKDSKSVGKKKCSWMIPELMIKKRKNFIF